MAYRQKADEAEYKAWELESKLNLVEKLINEKQSEINREYWYWEDMKKKNLELEEKLGELEIENQELLNKLHSWDWDLGAEI